MMLILCSPFVPSGELTTLVPLDRERLGELGLEVSASDEGTPPHVDCACAAARAGRE